MNRTVLFGVVGMGALLYVLGPQRSLSSLGGSGFNATDSMRRAVPIPPPGPKEALRGFRLIEQYVGKPRELVEPGEWPVVEAIIATVADPYDSHLDWSFDATQEAIRRAFETSGYVLDRFWIPDAKAIVIDPARRDTLAARTRYPGVLLFRPTDGLGTANLYLVYLVGETPTAGIHREAFRAALRERDSLVGPAVQSDTTPSLRVVGPTFSGSAGSLHRLLDEWKGTHPADTRPIRVISGSATSLDVAAFEAPWISFRATVQSDRSYLKALDTVRAMLRVGRGQVAVLSEGSTEYGRRVGKSADSAGAFITIPFPMNISSLREEYERHPDVTESQHMSLGLGQTARAPLSLQEDHHTTESPPVTSRLSVPAVEQIIGQIVRTLEQHDVRMVALLATDVRDKLFLAGEIKKRLREVQLITSESNVLYLRPDRYRSLHGMIVLSTYPLILENQRWTRADSSVGAPLMPFANEGAEGTYNAVLLQLGATDKLVDYQSPGDTIGARRPPVWVSSVGSASFVPLTFLPSYTDTGYVHGGGSIKDAGGRVSYRPAQMSYGQKGVVVMLALLLLIVALHRLLMLLGIRPGSEGIGGWPKDAKKLGNFPCDPYECDRAQVECSSLNVHEMFYAALQLVGLLGVCLPVAAVYLAIGTVGGGSQVLPWIAFVLVMGVAVPAFLLSTWRTVQNLWRTRRGDVRLLRESLSWKPERWSWPLEVASRYGVAVVTIIYLALIIGFSVTILRMGGNHSPTSWLFFVRAVQIDGELSPLPALMLSGISLAWWATWHLKRVELLRLPTPFELLFAVPRSAPGIELQSIQRTVRDTRQRLFMMVPGASGVLIGLSLVLALILLVVMFGATFERSLLGTQAFDRILVAGIVATLIGIPWGVCRLFVTWRSLRQHLEELRCLPLVTAFDRLPPRIARLTGFSMVSGSSRHVLGAVTRLQWLGLRNFTDHRLADRTGAAGTLGDPALIAKIDACMAELKPTDAADTAESHELRLRAVYPVLREAWDSEPQSKEIGVIERAVEGPDSSPDPDLASTVSKIRRTFASPARVWVRCAEEYFAVQSVAYIEGVFQQLRRLGLFLLVSLLLSTALLSSYPFYPKARVELVFLGLMVGAVTTVIAMMVQMNRDEVLSRISKSDPGRLNWDTTFVLNLVLFGILPLLSLFASEFPAIRGFLVGWLEPLARAMGKIA